ncbi:SPOR domain-containing protein [Pedobacter jeongneungensis]|uniref:SPOR domain-containing protein n=1 Tax=Pedobacter jeongneungensis TaxID=947309 RepID=UPI00046AA2E8|nr:SPOR domain-containing protein [Pedobacter jeongneungensis]
MDILSYLLELLQQRKEVGITGLGTFYKKKYPGRYDKEKQTFLPPGYTLQFSSDLTEEQALTDFIAAKRNISNESADYYIAQFVEDVNQKLELNHEIELENTGRLFFTEQGLDFEPIKNINYGSEFYGLPSLPETVTEEVKADLPKEEEDVYDEIAEAPVAPSPFENKSYHHPVIENVELDEVKDDLKNTLQHSENTAEEVNEAPEFIKEQHEEHPNRFGHTPESEVENIAAEHQAVEATQPIENESDNLVDTTEPEVVSTVEEPAAVEVPESVVEQHEEHPNRFGHTPEAEVEKIAEEPVETTIPEPVLPQQEYSSRFSLRPETDEPKTYIHLEDEAKAEEPVIEAPEFIKEQHAEHPNRFGHDPIIHDQEPPQGMSTWLKVTIIILVLVIIAAITYLVKPELFTGQSTPVKATPALVDSPKVTIDSAKIKQDSIAKTDSILKANQVQKKADTVKKAVVKTTEKTVVTPPVEKPKEDKIVPNTGPSTFDVIASSYKTVAGAEKYIAIMKTRGLNAKIANMAGPWKKVSIGSFKTQKEAEAQKDILQKKLKGKGFYVQQIFNNTQP